MLNVKKELQFGLVSILLVCLVIGFYTFQYNKYMNPLSSPSVAVSYDTTTVLTPQEVVKHNNSNDCWIIIENKVYSATDFLSRHPGGGSLITTYCGGDATQPFLTKDGRGNHSVEASRLLGLLYLGDINGKILKKPDSNVIKSIQINQEDDE
jgi:cytochrome b involved in lipid metabolism